MALDLTTALNTYGFVGTLANAIPDLKAKFEQAAREEWPPERFQREVQDTGWWKTNADTVRQLATLQATDPATYQQNLNNAANKAYLTAQQMGRPGGGPNAWQGVGLQALLNNWDDQQLKSFIGNTVSPEVWEGALTGDAGQLEGQLRKLGQDYGVPITDDYVRGALNTIQGGHETLDGYTNIIRSRAKATYPQFADQIDAGLTTRDIADPYIATMAKTLEIPETDLDLNDQYVKRALTSRGPDGTATSQPLWQFERQLKDDPRYDKTTAARTDAYSVLAKVGKDFGFAS